MRKYYRSALSFGLLSVLIVGLAFVLSGCSFLNQPPTAAFTWGEGSNPNKIIFDASGSSDPDGNIIAYNWEFGDGSTGTGEEVEHTYDSLGSYDVKLTVTDNKTAEDSVTKQVTTSVTLDASFTIDPNPATTGETVTFDASGSTGDIETYYWMPDAAQSEGWLIETTDPTTTVTYSQTGGYLVSLTIEDSEGDLAGEGITLTVES